MLIEKLLAACFEMSIVPKNKDIFTIVSTDQDTVYGCIELTDPPSASIPTGFESINIPQQLYSVITYTTSDQFRETYSDKYAC
jgi:hypothetical protein